VINNGNSTKNVNQLSESTGVKEKYSSKDNPDSNSLNYYSVNEKARTPISVKNIPETLRSGNFNEEKRNFKIDLTEMKNQENNRKMKIQQNFETFNNTPQMKGKERDNSFWITKEEQKLIKEDIETDTDDFDSQLFVKDRQKENISNIFKDSSAKMVPNFHPSGKPNTITHNRAYINEFGEESLLSDSSTEEKQNVIANKENKEVISGEKIIQNEYLYNRDQNEPYKRQLNPFINRDIILKKRSNDLLRPVNYNSRESNVYSLSNQSYCTKLASRMKWNTLNCKKLLCNKYLARTDNSMINNSYKSMIPKQKSKYSHSRSFKSKKHFSGRIDSSLESGSRLVKFWKKPKKTNKRSKSKTKYSSCSFRNNQGLNTNAFAQRRPSSTLEIDKHKSSNLWEYNGIYRWKKQL